MDMDKPAVGDESRGVMEQAAVGGTFLDESDHGAKPLGGGHEAAKTRIGSRVEGHFLGQVLQRVAGQPELGENDEAGLLAPGFREDVEMGVEVGRDVAELWRDLGQDGLHAPKISTKRPPIQTWSAKSPAARRVENQAGLVYI